MKIKLALFALLCLAVFSCAKDSGDYVQSVPVNLHLPMSDPRISKLNSTGGAVALGLNNGYTGSIAGLLLYNTGSGIVAFDRCSSYKPENHCAVIIDDTGFTATDPCSGSKFSLFDGSPVKAPATKSLRQYDAFIDGNFLLNVTN
jgi:hypothetical protein